uniref:C2H2-type domain-containing protein n=1 Tax=Panagrolaimus sp. ES5 TaxID=591445 RepID=A0AC34GCC7_9BILA
MAQIRTIAPPSRPTVPSRNVPAPSRAPVLQRAIPSRPTITRLSCEICDTTLDRLQTYLEHMQHNHKKLEGKTLSDMQQGAPLACSRCKDRFWCYDGLERHLVMAHGLVTQEFLRKAQNKQDGGRCQICKKQYAFNMLQHLVQEHQKNLCSAEIRYSCDVCQYSTTVYQELETHLLQHPKTNGTSKAAS